jgi:hypothetical protein
MPVLSLIIYSGLLFLKGLSNCYDLPLDRLGFILNIIGPWPFKFKKTFSAS